MRCPIETGESAELLLAYHSRKLDAASTTILKDHIEICPVCREFANGQRLVWEALDRWEAQPVSADFDRRLYQRIEREVSWWELLIRPFRPMFFRHGLPITASAAVLIMAGVLLEQPSATPVAPGTASAQVEMVAPEQAESALQEMELMREFNTLVRAETGEPKL